MIQIPVNLIAAYTEFITRSGVSSGQQQYYCKWLRFYFDFCRKYNFGKVEEEILAAFLDKLKEKRPAESQRKQTL